MATENILMKAVQLGGDRQHLHEQIRIHSQAAAAVIKQEGGANDLLARLQNDPAFADVSIADETRPELFVGRAPEQVDEFIAMEVEPIRARYENIDAVSADLRV